ncbi:putative PqqD family protein [Gammaproteobacteria bacterium]
MKEDAILLRETVLRVPDDEQVVSQMADDEVVIINFNTGVYFALGGSGVDFWSLLERGTTIVAMTEWGMAHWDVASSSLAADVEAFSHNLYTAGLIVAVNSDAPIPVLQRIPSSGIYVTPRFEKFDDLADSFAIDPPLPMVSVGKHK